MTLTLRPKALHPGDVVAVAALSNGLDPDEVGLLDRGIATIEGLGCSGRRRPAEYGRVPFRFRRPGSTHS
jgi:hypothetical protein